MRLAVMHNLWFYNHLMERIRDELDAGTFTQFHDRYVKVLGYPHLILQGFAVFGLASCRINRYNNDKRILRGEFLE